MYTKINLTWKGKLGLVLIDLSLLGFAVVSIVELIDMLSRI